MATIALVGVIKLVDKVKCPQNAGIQSRLTGTGIFVQYK